MKDNKLNLLGLAFALTLGIPGCGDSATDDTTSEASGVTGETTAETTGDGDCATHEPNMGGAADGTICTSGDDCESNFCLTYTDAPADASAVCAPADTNCNTRAVGTVFDFVSNAPIAGASIKMAGAIAASVNPVGAQGLAEATADADGKFDMTSAEPVEQPLGIVGIVSGTGYHLSATGLESPAIDNLYGPGTGIHDTWAVAETDLAGWNALLAGDAALTDYVPLGAMGGVIGKARDATTGAVMAGIEVQSADGDTTNSLVRYLNDAGDAFDGTATGTSGLFIIVNPGLGENFDAYMGGVQIDGVSGTAGSTSNSLFILIMDI